MKAFFAAFIALYLVLVLWACTCGKPGQGGTAEGQGSAAQGTTGSQSGSGAADGTGTAGGQGSLGTQGSESGSSTESSSQSADGSDTAASPPAENPKPSAKPAAVVKAPAAPVFETGPGPYASDIEVSVKAEEGVELRYSLDGSVPGPKNGSVYSEPIPLSVSTVVTAVAFRKGKASKPAARTFTLKEICVAPGGSGSGTQDRPSGSIGKAIAQAESLGIGEIKLASGEYRESLEIRSPVSLSGGWAAGFAKRGGSGSVIVGTSGGDKADTPLAAVNAIGARAAATLSRVELRAGSAVYTAGIFLKDGAQAYLTDCVVSGGAGTYSYAARLTKKSTISLTSCRLNGGEAENCTALSLDSSSARLVRSRAIAGSGAVVAYGVQCTSSSLLAASSIISGGNANQSYGAGIYASKGEAVSLLSCTVYGGGGVNCYAVFSTQSAPIVKDCLIGSLGSAKSFGAYENYGDSSFAALEGNAFWGSASGFYYDVDTKTAFSGFDDSGSPAGLGKVLATPKGKSNIAWSGSLGADLSTPQDAQLASGGIALDDVAATDIKGKKRSVPWSVGAFELD